MMGGSPDQEETPEQRALAEIAAQRFNRYKEVFVPLENQYIQDVFDVRDQANYEMAGGLAAAAYQPEFQKASAQMQNEMFAQGIDPSSGAFGEGSNALRRAAAVRQGQGVSAAKVANTDRFYRGLSGLIAQGQGQAGEAITGLGDIAVNAQEAAARAAENSFANSSMIRGGIMAATGYAASPYVDKWLGRPGSNPNTGMTTMTGGTTTTGGGGI